MRAALLAFAALIALTLLWPAINHVVAGAPAPSGALAHPALFVDATSWSGLSGSQHSCPEDLDRQYFVTGQAWADVDGDGIADLYLTNQCGPSTLYRGLGDGQFQPSPVTDQVALGGRQAGGAMFADVDGDGWRDLLVLTYDGPVLFHNDRGRGFVDVTAAAGLVATDGVHPMSAAAADYDGDGAPDLFVANYGCVRCIPGPRDEVRSQLFHNRGDGRFEDVSSILGGDGPMGFSFVGGWGDFDNDGDPDLYVTNDVRGGRSLHGNALYRNDGPGCGGWCFADVSEAAGAGVRADAMGMAVADFDGDGTLDVFVTNSGWAYTPLTGPSILLSNHGGGMFQDVAPASGAAVDAMSWGAAALDADSDGWTDLYVALGTDPASQGDWATTNRLLSNTGQGRFKDVTARSGAADTGDSFGVAAGDANGDGQADLVVGDYNSGYRLFLGTGGGSTAGHRLVVRLTGSWPVNRDAVGARIEAVLSDGRRVVHEVSLGGTLGGNHDPAFRTGTGSATVSRLSVRWPDGYSQAIDHVRADSEVLWTYAAEPEIRPLPGIAAYAGPSAGLTVSALGMPMPVKAGLVCVALLGLLPGRRRLTDSIGAAFGPATTGPRPARPSLSPTSRSFGALGRSYPVVFPSLRDPRLHLAAVITSLQVLGQTVLGFELSIAQILVSLLTCAVIELTFTFRRTRTVAWPASALLTGNGVAFILRVPGTQHGDWWSMNGWHIFAGVAGASLLSKYIIRDRSRHVFNPSNLGLVLCFLLLGSSRAEPLDFWWGPMSPGVVAAFTIILTGALFILARLRLLEMAAAFWLTFAASVVVMAAAGHCMSARWSFDPVCGAAFWRAVVMSPELLVFTFFMVTDPKTTPEGRVARVGFGSAVGFAAALFIAPQQTEFATKVALLASLTVVCSLRPWAERFFPAPRSERDSLRGWLAGLGVGRAPRSGVPRWGAAAKRGGAALVVVAVSLASLLASGVSARVPVAGLKAADALVRRPDVAIDASTFPPVTIDPGIRRLDANINEDAANAMARDLVAGLKIEALALEKADPELAKTAAAGLHLDTLLRDIEARRQGVRIEVSTYTFQSMKLVPVYDADNAQVGPRYGFEVRGSVHRVAYQGSSVASDGWQEDVPYERTFALLPRNGNFLVAADYPPAGP